MQYISVMDYNGNSFFLKEKLIHPLNYGQISLSAQNQNGATIW